MKGKRVDFPCMHIILKLIPLKLFLDMVPSSSADNVTTHVAWMFSWRMQMSVRVLVLSTWEKTASQDWLFLDLRRILANRECSNWLERDCLGNEAFMRDEQLSYSTSSLGSNALFCYSEYSLSSSSSLWKPPALSLLNLANRRLALLCFPYIKAM